VYTAGAGEVNSLSMSFTGTAYRFQDAAGVTITPTAPCTAVANVGTCPATGIDRLDASLGDQNDAGAADGSIVSPVSFVSINGQAGNDALTAAPNVETQLNGDDFGGAGNDLLAGGNRDDGLNGDGGNDGMSGGGGDDSLNGGPGNDTADGGAGDDFFTTFSGSFGPDGADVFAGGPGEDSFNADQRAGGIAVSLNDVADDGAACPGAGCEGDNVRSDIEDVRTGFGNDALVGSAQPNELDSGRGNDTVDGGAGPDQLFGDDGDDTLSGGPGNDFVLGADGADVYRGGMGDDQLSPGFGDSGADRLSGGPGLDSADALQSCCGSGGVRIDLDGKADDGLIGPIFSGPADNVLPDVEDLLGTDSSDILIGGKQPNQLIGRDGADRLIGGPGADGLEGDRGRDALTGGKGADEIDGGGGADLLRARDHRADDLRCGSAIDRLKADRVDRFGPDCDKVALAGRARR
jgi:Ca2+-binding RTX toxin-like protein